MYLEICSLKRLNYSWRQYRVQVYGKQYITWKMNVLIRSARRTRLSHPQPEYGSHRPKITATVLVRVLRTLPNNPSRYDDEGPAAVMFSRPGSCSRSGQVRRSLFSQGACTTPRRIRCQYAKGGMASCRQSTLPDPRDSRLLTSEIHYRNAYWHLVRYRTASRRGSDSQAYTRRRLVEQCTEALAQITPIAPASHCTSNQPADRSG
jgi:hypothetical protein